MRFSATILGAAVLVSACNGLPVSMFGEGSGTSGETSGTSGAETVGDACADGMDILGHCYHQTIFESVLFPRSAAAADFNDHGSQSVVTMCRGTSESFAICLLQTNGTVTKMDLHWLHSGQAQVHAGDFNDDDIPDLLVSEFNHFAIFIVDGVEFVLHSEFIYDPILDDPADALPFPALPIDIDQDGVSEIVTGGHYNGVQLWRPIAGGWAPAGERYPLSGCGDLQSGRIADVDGDGFPELVAIGSHDNCDEAPDLPGSGWNQISIFTGEDMGPGIAPMGTFAAALAAARLDLGDFNNDGDVDIVVGDDGVNMMVFVGNGDGTFESPLPLIGFASFSGDGPHAADFNADGFDEIVVEQVDDAYRLLVGLPVPTAIDLLGPLSWVLLAQDLNADGRADIVSVAKSDGEYRLAVTLSDP